MEKGTVSQLKTLMFTGHAAIIDKQANSSRYHHATQYIK